VKRRQLIGAMAVGLLAGPLSGAAQPSGRTPARVGFLGFASPSMQARSFDAFRQGLRDLGWIEGQNVTIESRWAEGDLERLPALAAELVRLNVDVIVTGGSAAVRAVQQATRTIPIVSGAVLVDPVAGGFAESLARPGGNYTGLASQYEEIVTKQVELLREVVPRLSRLAILHHTSVAPLTAKAAAAAADRLGLRAQILEVRQVAHFEGAFGTARRQRAQALLVLPNPGFNAHRPTLVALAASHRLPALYEQREFVTDGGLMSYGVDIAAMYGRAASYVHRILNGAKPGDLPIERAAKFELVVNLRTARALDLTIPPAVLARADALIQ
jgi:putative ABC transport system substrate-binding protein